ncbi:MAG: pilus assembly protein PilQ [Acidiferrobacteraceae bacterium]|nr:pilus assembly protein PilQ [Acidiferrobacteraceae bacterium]
MVLIKTDSESMINVPQLERIRPEFRNYSVRALSMYALLLAALLAPAVSLAVEPELVAVEHTVLSGGQLQVNIDTQGDIPAPKIFRTSQPDRIILDYFGVKSSVNPRIREVKRGAVDSVVVIGTEERARIIVNLVASVPFESQQSDSEIVLLIGQVVTGQQTEPGRSGLGLQDGAVTVSDPHHVTTVDFRRGPNSSGRVAIGLDRENVRVMVREERGEIVLDFVNTVLDDDLERRLDVLDFATPVQFVDTFSLDDRTRIVLSVLGAYDFVGFQSGKTFSAEVTPRADDAETKVVDGSYVGSPISFDFQNISVRGALQTIAEETGINFVISDSVTGDLTLRLKDVPWDQALETIMQIKGLAKREKNNVVWIAPAGEITENERLALESSLQMTELEPLVSELVQINYARAEDIADLLKSVKAVGPDVQPSMFGNVSITEVQTDENRLLSERGSVTVDSRTNTLLIQDMRHKILEVRKLISELDRPVKQVLIEARIVEANEDFSRNIGLKLGLTGINDSAGSIIGSGSLSNTATVRTDGISASGDGSLGVNLPAGGINGESPGSYALTLAKAGAGWAALIDLEISALEAEGNGKIVANPRLLTADKQEAQIEQGQERIFTTSTQGEGGVVTKKAVLSLTVEPQITPDDRVILNVFVTKDSFVSATEENINTLQVRTQVLLDNGETVVIGGIYEQQTSKTVTKIPLLGDLPFVGQLFKKKGILDNRRELLIFLTPRIINPALTGD